MYRKLFGSIRMDSDQAVPAGDLDAYCGEPACFTVFDTLAVA